MNLKESYDNLNQETKDLILHGDKEPGLDEKKQIVLKKLKRSEYYYGF